jgi:hypothetical protein
MDYSRRLDIERVASRPTDLVNVLNDCVGRTVLEWCCCRFHGLCIQTLLQARCVDFDDPAVLHATPEALGEDGLKWKTAVRERRRHRPSRRVLECPRFHAWLGDAAHPLRSNDLPGRQSIDDGVVLELVRGKGKAVVATGDQRVDAAKELCLAGFSSV